MKEASQILAEALGERKAANPSYSLRAFARDLGLSAPQLSNVINGHRGLSSKMAEQVANAMGLGPHEKESFKVSLRAKFSPSKSQRQSAKVQINQLREAGNVRFLDLDLFKAVSNWYHFALIELIKVSRKQKNSSAIFSKRLGIPESEVKLALSRLERLELIVSTAQGWKVNQDSVIAEQAIPSEAVRNFHRQILEKSLQALAFQKPEERYGYSAMMPIKVKNVANAKMLIQKFKTDFSKQISDHDEADEIYGLSIQFFKLTQNEEPTP